MPGETIERSEMTRATLSRIASDADVSISTVSKVLNGRSGVSKATRVRVEELLREHGYNRRSSGQNVAPLVELVFEAINSVWALELIVGAERVARDNGMSIVLTESGDRHAPSPDWIEGALRRRPAGVVLVFSDLPAAHRDKLRSRGVPFAIVDPAGDPAPDVPSVGSANWSGGLLATRHLIELGHTRIAAITGPADMMCSQARVGGYRAAMAAASLPVDADWVRYGDFHPTGGQNHARELLAGPDRPTAIFAGSDLQALGVIAAATEAGLSVPRDLSVVGYDDIALSRWLSPQLTTVHQPLKRMGEEAARIVLRLAEGETVDTLRMDLATHLVVRESTAAPAA